jgi:hypothetical protein
MIVYHDQRRRRIIRRCLMETTEAEGGMQWLEEEWLDSAQDRMLWERMWGLFSGIAIGVLMTIFVIGPGVGDRLFWEPPWYIVFAVFLGVIVVAQLRALLKLRGR